MVFNFHRSSHALFTVATFTLISSLQLFMKAPSAGQVFVCSNRWCREKGSDATLATFTFLTPQHIPVSSVICLGRCNKGPNARILTAEGTFVEATGIRSVEKVVQLLQDNLHLDINVTSAEVLRLNYEGNVHLREGKVDLAIECYDRALLLDDSEQEGVIRVMRGTALLQRAYACRMRHKDVVNVAEEVLPNFDELRNVMMTLQPLDTPVRSRLILQFLSEVCAVYNDLTDSPRWAELKTPLVWAQEREDFTNGEELIAKIAFTWSLYENSLMKALQDLLTATLVLPGFAQSWRRAGDALSEVRRFHSAIEYYEVAIQLDPSLAELLLPTIERLRLLERLVENAEQKGWSSEAILSLIEE